MAKKAKAVVVKVKPDTFSKLREAQLRYDKVAFKDSAGKSRVARINGDAVSRAMVGAGRDALVKIARANKLGSEVVTKIAEAKNAGQARMSLSNRLRAMVRRGEPVAIQGVEITSLTQSVSPPEPKKARRQAKAA